MRALALTLALIALASPALAATTSELPAKKNDGWSETAMLRETRPVLMEDLQNIKAPPGTIKVNQELLKTDAARKMREDAIREAALSYGARGALGARTWEIRERLKAQQKYLDKVFNFRSLLITTGSGLLIEPPIIGESGENLLIEDDGQQAAVADKVYSIGREAKIVTAPRNWRVYLEREWGGLEQPPAELIPQTDKERNLWRGWIKMGWAEGIKQADAVFQADLDRLVADYRGMVRYRQLLAQGMVSQPYATQVDRGVTGGGREMRIGDRALQITGPSELQPEPSEWMPVNR